MMLELLVTRQSNLDRAVIANAHALDFLVLDELHISFADDGSVLASIRLSEPARKALDLDNAPPLAGLREAHQANLALHRSRNGF
jgi:hypothetical protein